MQRYVCIMNDPQTPPSSASPMDRKVDSARLKALAHPLRVEILDQLNLYGPATSSMLAERLSESSGATSYHLRQLERHEFVREVEGRGTQRERWWETVPGGVVIGYDDEDDAATKEAGMLVARQVAEQRARHIDAFLRRATSELSEEWIAGTAMMSTRLNLTPAELAEANEALTSVVDQLVTRFRDRDAHPVPGTRPVQIQANVFALVDAPEELQ